MKLKEKNEIGITLIALVITIIVLIILAGISINLILGDNGIITKAQEAKAANQVAAIQEKMQLWKAEHEMSKYTGTEAKDLPEFLEELVTEGLLTEDQASEVITSENKELVIGDKTLSFLVEGQETVAVQVPEIEKITYTRNGNSINLDTVAYEKIPLEEQYIGVLTKSEGATYEFVAREDGTIVSENVENPEESEMPFADSYIKIDLTNVEDGVEVKIKATSSSLQEAVICTTDSSKNILEVDGEANVAFWGNLTQEATINIEAGTVKYIHFVYIYGGKDEEYEIEDNLTINSIEIKKKARNTGLTYKYTINGEDKERNSTSTSVIALDSSKLTGQEAVEGVSPKIPKGFSHLEGTMDEGYVISDLDQNYIVQVEVKNSMGEKVTKTIEITGNEFVWIPVKLEEGETFESKYPRTEFEENQAIESVDSAFIEPYTNGYEGEKEEYEAMLASVNLNKGFYIGRYETGFIGETAKTDRTSYSSSPTQEEIETETAKLVVQKDAQIYNYVPWGSGMDDITANLGGVIGAVQLAQNFAKVNNYTGVTSTLMYGIQWDMVMRYVVDENHNVNDSSSWGNYSNSEEDAYENSGSIQTAGKNEEWKAKNIYDLAGNVEEWTMEAYSNNSNIRVYRGGDCHVNGTDYPASYRLYGGYDPVNVSNTIGFRVVLCVE